MSLYVMITVTLILSGILLQGLERLARSPFGARHQIREGKDHGLTLSRFRRTAAVNSLVSPAVVYGFAYLLGARTFHAGAISPTRCLLEGAAVLLTYDFFYYFVHRYPFHEWRILRGVHAVHHIVRNPSPMDSLFLHPLENFLGLGLLWACVFGVSLVAGPLSVYSFGWAFLVYSVVNIVVHAGMDVEVPGLRFLSYLAVRHNKHHVSMKGKNYAAMTPTWDLVFRTEEP